MMPRWRSFDGPASGRERGPGGEAGLHLILRGFDQRQPAYGEMLDVTSADAARAGAVVRLVLAQGTISSQLIDNLNASSHLPALFTELFLLDDVV